MTWGEIKQAVQAAGIEDEEEIGSIQCENSHGDHTFHKVSLGKRLNLKENVSPAEAREDAERLCGLIAIVFRNPYEFLTNHLPHPYIRQRKTHT